jgi:hypothetical protein
MAGQMTVYRLAYSGARTTVSFMMAARYRGVPRCWRASLSPIRDARLPAIAARVCNPLRDDANRAEHPRRTLGLDPDRRVSADEIALADTERYPTRLAMPKAGEATSSSGPWVPAICRRCRPR